MTLSDVYEHEMMSKVDGQEPGASRPCDVPVAISLRIDTANGRQRSAASPAVVLPDCTYSCAIAYHEFPTACPGRAGGWGGRGGGPGGGGLGGGACCGATVDMPPRLLLLVLAARNAFDSIVPLRGL